MRNISDIIEGYLKAIHRRGTELEQLKLSEMKLLKSSNVFRHKLITS